MAPVVRPPGGFVSYRERDESAMRLIVYIRRLLLSVLLFAAWFVVMEYLGVQSHNAQTPPGPPPSSREVSEPSYP